MCPVWSYEALLQMSSLLNWSNCRGQIAHIHTSSSSCWSSVWVQSLCYQQLDWIFTAYELLHAWMGPQVSDCLVPYSLRDLVFVNWLATVIVPLKFLTRPYILFSFWRPVVHSLFSPVQVEWQHPSTVCRAIGFVPEAAKIFTQNLMCLIQWWTFIVPEAFGLWWVVWLRNDFPGVTLVSTPQPSQSNHQSQLL